MFLCFSYVIGLQQMNAQWVYRIEKGNVPPPQQVRQVVHKDLRGVVMGCAPSWGKYQADHIQKHIDFWKVKSFSWLISPNNHPEAHEGPKMNRSSAFHIIPHWFSDGVLFCLGEGIAVRSLLHLQPLDQKMGPIGGQHDQPPMVHGWCNMSQLPMGHWS